MKRSADCPKLIFARLCEIFVQPSIISGNLFVVGSEGDKGMCSENSFVTARYSYETKQEKIVKDNKKKECIDRECKECD